MDESTFHIGFSGHQQLGDQATVEFVSQQLRELLGTYRDYAYQHGKEIVAYSALALGADQLFIAAALDLGIPVEMVIPCSNYEEIFTTPEDREKFHRFLKVARHIHHLPAQECCDNAYLAAGEWIVDHSDLIIVVWNGYPAAGRGGTADVVSHARFLGCPFIHVHTRLHSVKQYGELLPELRKTHMTASRRFAVAKQAVYQGPVLTVNQYRMHMPDGKDIVRDIVERPESVLVLPVGQKQTVLLIEEYDLAAETWQLTLPGGKVDNSMVEGVLERAMLELREETGYRAGRLEKLLDFYGHPGYMAHKVHAFVAHDLEWNPLEMDGGEMIRVRTFALEDALAETRVDYRCDPEAALMLWLYAGRM